MFIIQCLLNHPYLVHFMTAIFLGWEIDSQMQIMERVKNVPSNYLECGRVEEYSKWQQREGIKGNRHKQRR